MRREPVIHAHHVIHAHQAITHRHLSDITLRHVSDDGSQEHCCRDPHGMTLSSLLAMTLRHVTRRQRKDAIILRHVTRGMRRRHPSQPWRPGVAISGDDFIVAILLRSPDRIGQKAAPRPPLLTDRQPPARNY
jgi:hypothetical protein